MRFRITLRKIRIAAVGALLIVIGFGGGFYWGVKHLDIYLANGIPQVKVVNRETPEDKSEVDFALFWEVWDRLHREYLEPSEINNETLVYGAIKGMTAAIGDPYTVFLPPQDNQRAKDDLNGEFEGVGIQLGYINEQLAVIAPLEGMPAQAVGVKAADLILYIKDDNKDIDTDTQGMSLQEAVTLIRGPKGTPVTLTLYRENKGDFEVTIRRDTIIVPSVELKIGDFVDDGWVDDETASIAWLRVYRFGERTFEQWNEAVDEINLKEGQLTGVVLDLRNNPGGFFKGSIDIASEFIPEGVVVKQKSRTQTETFSVQRRGRLLEIPLIVLINKGSASASEILAGALRDQLGVQLIGERSFGKGTVQDAVDLRDNAGLHVTIARWLLPGGDWIHDEGLEPDILVAFEEVNGEGDEEMVDLQLKRAIEELIKL